MAFCFYDPPHLGQDGEVEEPVAGLVVQPLPQHQHRLPRALQRKLFVLVARGDRVADVGVGRVGLVPVIRGGIL